MAAMKYRLAKDVHAMGKMIHRCEATENWPTARDNLRASYPDLPPYASTLSSELLPVGS